MNGTVESSPNTECGSVATYSCASGFVLEGVVSRLCQQDGQWSDEMPSCDREFSLSTYKHSLRLP